MAVQTLQQARRQAEALERWLQGVKPPAAAKPYDAAWDLISLTQPWERIFRYLSPGSQRQLLEIIWFYREDHPCDSTLGPYEDEFFGFVIPEPTYTMTLREFLEANPTVEALIATLQGYIGEAQDTVRPTHEEYMAKLERYRKAKGRMTYDQLAAEIGMHVRDLRDARKGEPNSPGHLPTLYAFLDHLPDLEV
jgi:hypothetical protein